MNFEQECFQMILHGGNGRSLAFEAIQAARQGEHAAAKNKIQEAKAELLIASRQHAAVLQRFVTDQQLQVSMLLVHAEDHISSSQVMIELVQEMIMIYERMDTK